MQMVMLYNEDAVLMCSDILKQKIWPRTWKNKLLNYTLKQKRQETKL